jgi:hypothetical protein
MIAGCKRCNHEHGGPGACRSFTKKGAPCQCVSLVAPNVQPAEKSARPVSTQRMRVHPLTLEQLALGGMAYEMIKDTPLGKVIDGATDKFFEEMKSMFAVPPKE